MPLVVPTPIPALPVPPTTTDSANFDTRADAFNAALQNAFQPAANALAGATYANAQHAQAQAEAAVVTKDAAVAASAVSAQNAEASAASAGATRWLPDVAYAVGDTRWSPATRMIYRRIVAGAGSTDPSVDAASWSHLGRIVVVAMAANNMDLSLGDYFSKTITANTTLTVSNVPAAPVRTALIVRLTVTSGVITLPAGWMPVGGVVPAFAVGKTHLLFAVTEGDGTWRYSALLGFGG